jgi:hypothetical protein
MGELDREDANTASPSQDQHTLAGLQVTVIEDALPGSRRADGNGGRLGKTQCFWFQRQSILCCTG